MDIKERIVEEASKLFFRKGIKSVTMSDLANQLGISKRTLYEIFQDKEMLLLECVNRSVEKANWEMKELAANSGNVIDALMQVYSRHLRDLHQMNSSVIHDMKKYHPKVYQVIDQKHQNNEDILYPLFRKGMEQGLIRGDIDFEILMWLLKAQFKTLIEGDFVPTTKYQMDDFVQAIILNFVRGISTIKGIEIIDNLVRQYNEQFRKKNN